MSNKATLFRFLPGNELEVSTLPAELGVVTEKKTSRSIMLLAPPADYKQASRVHLPWAKATAIAGAFGGDGEAINFEAGPFEDWREFTETDNHEQDEARLVSKADEEYAALEDRAGKRCLMRASDATYNAPGIGQRLMTLTYITVLIVLSMTMFSYFDQRGGINGVFGSSSDAIEDVGDPLEGVEF